MQQTTSSILYRESIELYLKYYLPAIRSMYVLYSVQQGSRSMYILIGTFPESTPARAASIAMYSTLYGVLRSTSIHIVRTPYNLGL